MSIAVMTRVWGHSKQKGSNLLLTLALADHANDDGICWPGLSSLHKKVRMSERQTQRILDGLIATGEVYIKPGNGRGHKSFYAVLSGLDAKAISKLLQDNFEMSKMEANDTAEQLYQKRCQDVTLKRKGVKKSPIDKKGDKLSERVTFSAKKGDISKAGNLPQKLDADNENGQTSKTTIIIEPSLETSIYLSHLANASATDALGSEFDETPVTSKALTAYQQKQATAHLSAEEPDQPIEPESKRESTEPDKPAVREDLKSPLPVPPGFPADPLAKRKKPKDKPNDWSVLTKAMYEAIPDNIRPPRCHYGANNDAAKALWNIDYTPERIAAYVKDVYQNDGWFKSGGAGGTPIVINMSMVEKRIKAWEAKRPNGNIKDGRYQPDDYGYTVDPILSRD